MQHRARSSTDKLRRTEDLLDAAATLARELGGVRLVTLAKVTEQAGLDPSGVRRYFASREELFLELAERGWDQWRELVSARCADAHDLAAAETAAVLAETLGSLPLFCDLLTHVPLSLEGTVDIERARRYKTNSFVAYDTIVEALCAASVFSAGQASRLVTVALALAANLWQLSNPSASLRRLYEDEPRWRHAALNFVPRLTELLAATALGLSDARQRR